MQELRLADQNLEILKVSPNTYQANQCSLCPGLTNHSLNQCWKKHPEKMPKCESCGGKGHNKRNCRKKEIHNFEQYDEDDLGDDGNLTDPEVKYMY